MAKRLEKKVKITELREQISRCKNAENEHVGYYLSNIIRIIFGRKPHRTSPYNIFNNSDLGDY